MQIIDDDVETLLTLDMSIEEAKRKRSLVQQRTDHLLFDGAAGVSEAELSHRLRNFYVVCIRNMRQNWRFQLKLYDIVYIEKSMKFTMIFLNTEVTLFRITKTDTCHGKSSPGPMVNWG